MAELKLSFAEMIRRAIATPVTYADREVFLTVSIGIALHEAAPGAGQGGQPRREEVFKNAEMAMIQSKRGGGDQDMDTVIPPPGFPQRHRYKGIRRMRCIPYPTP